MVNSGVAGQSEVLLALHPDKHSIIHMLSPGMKNFVAHGLRRSETVQLAPRQGIACPRSPLAVAPTAKTQRLK